jgi:hypothetical protein
MFFTTYFCLLIEGSKKMKAKKRRIATPNRYSEERLQTESGDNIKTYLKMCSIQVGRN